MIAFNEYCIKEKEFNTQCVNQAYDAVGLDKDAVEECMEGSFESTGGKIKDNISDNKLLKAEYELKGVIGLQYYPAVVINGEVYRVYSIEGSSSNFIQGNLNSYQIKEAVCSSFIKGTKPDSCFNHGHIDSGSEFYVVIMIVVIVLVIFLLLMIFGYKKMVKQEMSKEMNIQINNLVSKYFSVEE